MNLDGENDNPPVSYSPTEHQQIWQGLFRLATAGAIVMVAQTESELIRNHTGDLSWLSWMPKLQSVLGTDANLDAKYKTLIGRFRMFKLTIRHTLDPADPWIVAMAWHHGDSTVVSDEPLREDRHRRKTYDYVPDVCRQLRSEGIMIDCLTFHEMVQAERLLT